MTDLMNGHFQHSCRHKYLVPLEIRAGKRCFNAENQAYDYMDWTSTLVSAHRLRVTKFYCPDCGEIISVPLTKPDSK